MRYDTSGPAFPQPILEQRDSGPVFASDYSVGGMTLRQWYAGVAMQGMLGDSEFDAPAEDVAKAAFSIADAMLAQEAREQEGQPE